MSRSDRTNLLKNLTGCRHQFRFKQAHRWLARAGCFAVLLILVTAFTPHGSNHAG